MIKINEPVNIDPEFQSLLPPLSAEEYEKLSGLCQKHGIQDKLKIWNGILIDGHNRYQIANEYGLNYEIEDMTGELPTRSAVVNWIIENQGARRNLTKSQLVRAWEQWEAERAKEAKERQGTRTDLNISSNLNESSDPIRTAAEVAEKIGVSENTYRDMKLVTNEGTQEQIDRMDKKVKVKGKTNSVSGIKAEIVKDKKIINEKGTEEQKERLKKGGKGNKPAEIAQEIKQASKEAKEPQMLTCTKCGNTYPIDYFGSQRKQCKFCRDKVKHGQFRDVKGDLIKSTGEFAEVSDDEVIGSLYETDSVSDISIEDVVNELRVNFNSYLSNLKRTLSTHKDIVKLNKKQIEEVFDYFEQQIKSERLEIE